MTITTSNLEEPSFNRNGTIESFSNRSSSARNRDLTAKMKVIEDCLKQKLSNGWISVRKAFLDLDCDFDGYITAEEFAKLIGGNSG